MFKKIVKMMLFVFVVFAFCGVKGQVSYAGDWTTRLPSIGLPNSVGYEYGSEGQITKERRYGPDGRAIQDTDYEHGGSNHKFPHDHEWDWSKGNKKPDRKPGVPRPGAKKLPQKQKDKNDENNKKGKRPRKRWSIRRIVDRLKGVKFPQISKGAKKAAALGTAGTITYFIISEGSRIIFPVRNLIPVV